MSFNVATPCIGSLYDGKVTDADNPLGVVTVYVMVFETESRIAFTTTPPSVVSELVY
jgi:hypothetical protein